MKKQDNDDLKPISQDLPERLESVAFHLTQLYQRLSQDFDRWAVTGGDLAETVETFEKQLQQLSTLEEQIRQQLKVSIEESTQRVTTHLIESFQQATKTVLTQEIKSSADDLSKTVQAAERALEAHQREIRQLRTWYLSMTFISALLGSIIGGLVLYQFLS